MLEPLREVVAMDPPWIRHLAMVPLWISKGASQNAPPPAEYPSGRSVFYELRFVYLCSRSSTQTTQKLYLLSLYCAFDDGSSICFRGCFVIVDVYCLSQGFQVYIQHNNLKCTSPPLRKQAYLNLMSGALIGLCYVELLTIQLCRLPGFIFYRQWTCLILAFMLLSFPRPTRRGGSRNFCLGGPVKILGRP